MYVLSIGGCSIRPLLPCLALENAECREYCELGGASSRRSLDTSMERFGGALEANGFLDTEVGDE
jgi:hypothetical protein